MAQPAAAPRANSPSPSAPDTGADARGLGGGPPRPHRFSRTRRAPATGATPASTGSMLGASSPGLSPGRDRWQPPGFSLDPRRRLSATIGWTVFAVVTLAATLGAFLAANQAERQIRQDNERLLQQFASQIAESLQMQLLTRRSIIQASAAQIIASTDRGDEALTHHLAAVRKEFPEFAWLGIADERGQLIASTGHLAESRDVSTERWFQQGRVNPYLGQKHPVPTPAEPAPAGHPHGHAEVIDIAVPLRHADGRVVGVIAGRLAWDWLSRITHSLERRLDPSRQLQVWLLDSSDLVLVRPADAPAVPTHHAPPKAEHEAAPPAPERLNDPSAGGRMLVGRYFGQIHPHSEVPDWDVVVRQDMASAARSGRRTRNLVFVVTWVSGLLAALVGAWATHTLLRRLRRLSEQAIDLQRGTRHALVPPEGVDEVAQIGGTLASAIDQLQQEKQALVRLNAELDRRVAERTARIERMAVEARQVAVGRERLRMARDLHDTLAQSLAALLTQLRLIRKLHPRLTPEELNDELQTAERAAAEGLQEARAAITRMRHRSVGKQGLDTALLELITQFKSRTGIDARVEGLALLRSQRGERAEALFRIVEEALRNIERHAEARSIRLRIGVQGAAAEGSKGPRTGEARTHLRLLIEDDGVGFDPDAPHKPGHYGLRGIAEQAALIQATLSIHSQPGRGTTLLLSFER